MKARMYAITTAKIIVILFLSCLWPVFFLINILAQVSELYLTGYDSFMSGFRTQLQQFHQLTNPKK